MGCCKSKQAKEWGEETAPEKETGGGQGEKLQENETLRQQTEKPKLRGGYNQENEEEERRRKEQEDAERSRLLEK